jgi:hypothetical protein
VAVTVQVSSGGVVTVAGRQIAFSRTTLGLLAVGSLGVGLIVGWLLTSYVLQPQGLIVRSEITGTIAVANASGDKVCIAPNSGGAQVCGELLEQAGLGPLKVGDEVTVALASLKGDSGSTDVMVVESRGGP